MKSKLERIAGNAAGKALAVFVVFALWPVGILICAFEALVWPFALLRDVLRPDDRAETVGRIVR